MQFVDTNVLLYAISRDPDEAAKAKRANEILAAGDVGLSVQVLQEFYVQATRASRRDPISHEQALADRVVAPISGPGDDHRRDGRRVPTRQRFGISYWDAAIIEASRSWLRGGPLRRSRHGHRLRRRPRREPFPRRVARRRGSGRSADHPGRTLARPANRPSDFRRSLGEPAKIRSHGCVEWYDTGRAAPSLTPRVGYLMTAPDDVRAPKQKRAYGGSWSKGRLFRVAKDGPDDRFVDDLGCPESARGGNGPWRRSWAGGA